MNLKPAFLFGLASLIVASAFAATPAQHQTVFIDRDAYQNIIHPPEYWGASAQELVGDGAFNVTAPVLNNLANTVWEDSDMDGYGDVPADESWELKEHYLLNQLVEDLGGDPIALAAYVQNEVSLTQGFQSIQGDTSGILKSALLVRGAYGVFLEKQGSPWEQSALLVYLLRRAGYPASIVESSQTSYLMRADRLDRIFGFRISESLNPNDIVQVDYPWVVVNDAKDGSGTWRHLFPWLDDVVFEEGFDVYDFLPVGYQTGEEWTDQYLQNDSAISALVGPNGKDAAGELFPKFVAQFIADDALSLEDIGFSAYTRKLQYNEWSDFPKPFFVASLVPGDFGGPISVLVKENGLIATDSSRFAGVQFRVRDQFNNIFLETDPIPLALLTNRQLYFYRDGVPKWDCGSASLIRKDRVFRSVTLRRLMSMKPRKSLK
jgi:hypothetical protein